MRKRNRVVYVRMTDSEYQKLHEKMVASGQSAQSIMISALNGTCIATREEMEALYDMNMLLADYVRQVRGIATNINQLAHMANSLQYFASLNELRQIREKIVDMKSEGEGIWQSIRQLISHLRHMQQ